MGGKALGYESRRVLKDEFLEIEQYAVQKLLSKFDRVLPTVYYRSKESFGDLDLIVPKPVPLDIIEWLYENFNATKVVYNGDSLENSVSISFDEDEFQIDLIFVHPDNLDIAHFYYSYNDLNNYVGRVAAQYNMKFGFNGLYYETADEDFLISKDREKIYTFLGFNYQRYVKGFDTLEDTFEYVVMSKQFNSSIYQWENLNNINRSRNQKRPNYQKFLDYLKDNDIAGGYVYPNKNLAVTIINDYFPESKLQWKLNEQHNNKIRHEKVKEILNSEIVKQTLNCDWNKVRSVIDQIYAIPNVEKTLVGMKQQEMIKLIYAAALKDEEPQSFEIGQKVMFRSNDNRYYEATLLTNTSDFYKLQTSDMMVYKIKHDRIKHIEDWFDFKTL